MAWGHVVKVLIGVSCFSASLWGVKNTDVDAMKMRLTRLLGKIDDMSHLRGGREDKHSTCQVCLEAGKDFCIASNKCIPRATLNCEGPHDHITGDKEFALHGNPEGIRHSMTCPEPSPKKDKNYDAKDCYYDKECHAKVDWEKIGKIKDGFLGRVKYCKEKDDVGAVKQMFPKVHAMFQEAGVPDDRIDYILVKWVKYVWPEAFDKSKKVKDCYFDKECHAKVDWEKIGKIKGGFFARLKLFKEKGNAEAVKEMLPKVHKMFLEAGMPDDRINFILMKWVKSVYPEALEGDKPKPKPKFNMCMIAKKRCMKDGEKVLTGRCGMVWDKCGHELKGRPPYTLPMCMIAKKRCVKDGEKVLTGRCGMIWDKCGHEFNGDKPKPKPKFNICKIAKMKCMKGDEKVLTGRCGMVWDKCGHELGVLV